MTGDFDTRQAARTGVRDSGPGGTSSPTAASGWGRWPWPRSSASGRPAVAGAGAMPARRDPRRRPAACAPTNPLAARPGHFPARAKSVIYLFMAGGPSQLELFDYKPRLQEYSGQPIPDSFIRGSPVRIHGYLHQGASQAAGDGPEVRAARPVGGMGLGAACRTWPGWWTT